MRRQSWLVGLLSGALFAVGLALSGMTDPARVLGFLDVAGAWDPSLILVMGGAVGFHFTWLRFAPGAKAASSSAEPSRRVDARLVSGAALFGVGWGLSGYCPGPALAAAAFGRQEAVAFLFSMLLGIVLFRAFEQRRSAELASEQ